MKRMPCATSGVGFAILCGCFIAAQTLAGDLTVDGNLSVVSNMTVSGTSTLAPDSLAVGTNQLTVVDGKVGVGTNSPQAKLHVDGTARFEAGVVYVPPLGDLTMGVYTNQ